MPLYEFACRRCSKQFEEIVHVSAAPPACPTCARPDEVERLLAAGVTVGRKEDLRPPYIKGTRPPRR